MHVDEPKSVGANAENENDLSAIPAAVAAAKLAEVVVAVVGDTMSTCGEMVLSFVYPFALHVLRRDDLGGQVQH